MAVPVVYANKPVAGSISWDAFTIQYLGTSYAIGAGSTSKRWVWWRYNTGGATTIIEAENDVPDGQVVNQLLNPSFEVPDDADATLPKSWIRGTTGTIYWATGDTATLSSVQALSGVQSLALTTGTVGGHGPSIMQTVTLTPGVTYRITFRARASVATTGTLFGIMTNAAGTAELFRFAGLNGVSVTTGWQVYTGTSTIVAGVTAGRIQILSYSAAAGTVMYVDDVEFGEVSATAALVDDDLVLLGNKNGVPFRVQSSSFLDGDLLIDGSVAVKALAAEVIMANDVYSKRLKADQIDAGQLSAALAIIGGGGLTVGDGITISSEKGVEVVHQAAAPGVEAIVSSIKKSGISLRAGATTDWLIMLGNTVMRGKTNEIATGAELAIQAGTTPPAAGPQITSEYPAHTVHEGYSGRGLVAFPAEGANVHLQTESLYGGIITKLVKATADNPAATPPVKTGDYEFGWDSFSMDAVRTEITSALGGVTVLGTEVYALCQTSEAVPGTYYGRWYVYQWHYNGGSGTGRLSYVRRWLYEPHGTLGGNSTWRPSLGNDGTNLLVVQSSTLNYWVVSRYGPTGTYIGLANLYDDPAKTKHTTAGRNMSGIVGSTADVGTACWWVTHESSPYVFCVGSADAVRIPANDFSGPVSPTYGLMWDGTRFVQRSTATVYDFSRIKDTDLATNPVKAVQTWRLNNTTAPAYATSETAASPAVSTVALKKRAYVRLSSMSPIPDEPGDPNDPDSLSFYLARGAGAYMRIPPYFGTDKATTSVLLDTLPTSGLPPPAVTSWGTATAGRVRPAATATDTNGLLWDFEGDGSFRLGELAGDKFGRFATEVLDLPVTGGFTGSLRLTKMGGWISAFLTVTSATFVNASFTTTGVAIPVGWRPPEVLTSPAATVYGQTISYQFQYTTAGVVNIRKSATNSLAMLDYMVWRVTP